MVEVRVQAGLYFNFDKLAAVRKRCRDITNELENITTHRDRYLRHEQEALLHLLMDNQHWDQELQGKGGMRPLKLLPEFMEAQMNILQPLLRDCLTLCRKDANWILSQVM